MTILPCRSFIEAREESIGKVYDTQLLILNAVESQLSGSIQETEESTTVGLLRSPLGLKECKVGLCPFLHFQCRRAAPSPAPSKRFVAPVEELLSIAFYLDRTCTSSDTSVHTK